jgi:hypothetical protein
MSAAKEILKIAPLMQSAMILNENVKLFKKKKKKSSDFIGVGVKSMIGMEFIKAESNLIGSFD